MQTISTLLVLLAVSLLLGYVYRKTGDAKIEEIESKKVMKSDKSLAYLGFLVLLMAVVLPVTYFVGPADQRMPNLLIFEIVLLIVFGFLGFYLISYYRKTRVEFNEEIVRTTNFLGKSKEVRWADVKSVDFRKGPQWLILKTDDLRVSVHVLGLSGFPAFKNQLMGKLPESMYKDAFVKMKR